MRRGGDREREKGEETEAEVGGRRRKGWRGLFSTNENSEDT